MDKNSWSSFTKRIPVTADERAVYAAWTSQQALQSWFLKKALFWNASGSPRSGNEPIQTGDRYEWSWHGYPQTNVERNQILAANGRDFLQFSFAGDCVVTVMIKKEEGETLVELTQENLPEDKNPFTNLYIACGEGWTFYLANLKSVLEGGLDLRNKNENIRRVISS